MMDMLLYFVLLEQIIANAAIAAVVVVFGRGISRILESNTQPALDVKINGDLGNNVLTLTNYSAGSLSNLQVAITEANVVAGAPTEVRKLYSGAWESLGQSNSIAVTKPITAELLLDEGLGLTTSEFLVECRFRRSADGRPFYAKCLFQLAANMEGRVEFRPWESAGKQNLLSRMDDRHSGVYGLLGPSASVAITTCDISAAEVEYIG